MNLLERLPDELKMALKERVNALQASDFEFLEQMRVIRDRWVMHGKRKLMSNESVQRRMDVRQAWMDQLSNDPLWATGKKAEDSKLWIDFLRYMEPV